MCISERRKRKDVMFCVCFIQHIKRTGGTWRCRSSAAYMLDVECHCDTAQRMVGLWKQNEQLLCRPYDGDFIDPQSYFCWKNV